MIYPLNLGLNELANAQRADDEEKELGEPPTLTENDETRIKRRKLAREIREETRGMERFQVSPSTSFSQTAIFSIRCGYDAVEEIRAMAERAREYFLDDIRGKNSRPLHEVKLPHELFDLFEHQPRRKSAKGPVYEEICIPDRLTNWKVDLCLLSSWIKPDQDMCNAISLEIARGKHCKPRYIPYVVVSTHGKPWLIQTSAHERALGSWRTRSRRYRKDLGRQCSLRAWPLYTVRFIFSAELTGALSEFGGIQAQFGLLSVILSLAAVENATFPREYNKQIDIFLLDSPRARRKDIEYPAILHEEHPLITAMCKRDMPNLQENFAATSSSSDKPHSKWSRWANNKKGKGKSSWQSNSNIKKGKGKGESKSAWNSNKKWNNSRNQAGKDSWEKKDSNAEEKKEGEKLGEEK